MQSTGSHIISLNAALQGLAQVQQHIEYASTQDSPEQQRIRELEGKLAKKEEWCTYWEATARHYRTERNMAQAANARLEKENKEMKKKMEEVKKQWSGMAGALGEKVPGEGRVLRSR